MSKHICKWCKNIISEDEIIWNPDENGDGYHLRCLNDKQISDAKKEYISKTNIKRILKKYSGYLTADVWDSLMDNIEKFGESNEAE